MIQSLSRILSLVLALGLSYASPTAAQVYAGKAVAVDGDSLEIGGKRFRLYGIDALEARQTCTRREKAWRCGEEAAATLRGLIRDKNVSCDQKDIDRYGRIVAVCTANRRDLAQVMVSMGLAVALPEFTADYVEWEGLARQRGLGIWAAEFQRPSEFRAGDEESAREERAMLAEQQRGQSVRNAQELSRRAAASTSGVYYRNCSAARAAGAAPLYRGQPGYRPQLDADGDGVACEPYQGR
ncbi:excalibur calcium-binding domain-containing protein [Qipengyuania mesophila]|uniref:excalibur calcium-binding domain-containing protein n=1 Tax=Qipengyuania mesophila TaxID=2867246 RepID=UPI003511DD5C